MVASHTHRRPAPSAAPEPQGPRLLPVLTLWEPWASAVVHGAKSVENREWFPPARIIGRDLVIHAAIRRPDAALLRKYQEHAAAARRAGQDVPELTIEEMEARLGHILGVVRVTGAIDTHTAGPLALSDPWLGGARYGWRLTDKRPCVPIRATGKQGLWSIEASVVEDAVRQWRVQAA